MSRLTRKGQVTIPKAIRQILGIAPGDEVEFRFTQDRQVVVARASTPSPFAKYVGYLSRKAGQHPDRIVSELRGDTK